MSNLGDRSESLALQISEWNPDRSINNFECKQNHKVNKKNYSKDPTVGSDIDQIIER